MDIALVLFFVAILSVSHYMAISVVLKYWRLAHLGQPFEPKTSLADKLKSVVMNVFLQKKLFKKPVRGILHVFIFYGFIAYGLHTTSQFIGGFFGNFEVPFVGGSGYEFYIPAVVDPLIPGFLHVYDYTLDIFTVLVLVGLISFGLRRWAFRAPELDRPSRQSAIVITMISSLMIFTLLSEPARAIFKSHFEGMSPLRSGLVYLFQACGVDSESAYILYLVGWWGHILTVFAFMVYVPRSKHAHLIWAPVNFYFQSSEPKGAIPFLDTENAEVWGAANVQDFTWKNHLDGLSCIECGRCTIECPANRTGKVLNPKSIMVDLKHALMGQMELYEAKKKEGKSNEDLMADPELRVIDTHTPQEALWACTTCYACVDQCPVGNNQVEAILQMRRSLVLNEGSLPTELQNALTNIENQSNPWGVGAHKREDWTEGLDVRTMAQWAEAGEKPDVLFWVGCAGAFDDRNKKITQSITSVLNKANIKFGILGTEENCTGDSARRAGNEYLFQMLAQQNIETMQGYDVKNIVTGCPHCFNTLKNEYPQLGGRFNVIHHSEYISNLVDNKNLNLEPEKNKELGQVTYHDSCYLGRYNSIYSEPRKTIQAATGNSVIEPVDNKVTGLCCGAGGAQMWKEEENGNDRVNLKRTNQLLDTGAKTVASACPFCITMVDDGVKNVEKEDSIKTLDIAEIVDRASI